MALRIKEIRLDRGITQTQLAEMAGVSRSQLSEIETEAKPANTLRLNSIAKALDVDVDALFHREAGESFKHQLTEIIDRIEEDADRDALLRMATALASKNGPAS